MDIKRYLVRTFGNQRIETITRERMQSFLEEIARKLSSSVVGHLRWHLNAIFTEGRRVTESWPTIRPLLYTFPMRDPGSEASHVSSSSKNRAGRPRPPRSRDTPARCLQRPETWEIFAIRLEKIGDNFITVDQRIYAGKLDSPKGRKGKNTTRIVGLTPATASEIELWHSFLQNREPDAYLFPSETLNTPLRPDNLWKRGFQPPLEALGLGWVNFQVLRRTNASLSSRANVDDKVSADQRVTASGSA